MQGRICSVSVSGLQIFGKKKKKKAALKAKEVENLSPSKTSKNEKSGKKKDLSWEYFSFFQTLGIEVEFYSRCRRI